MNPPEPRPLVVVSRQQVQMTIRQYVLMSLLVFGCVPAIAAADCIRMDLLAGGPGICVPKALKAKPNTALSSRHAGTTCVSFGLPEAAQAVGLMCVSSSQEFLSDFGVMTDQDGRLFADGGRGTRGVSVATGMSLYSMEVMEDLKLAHTVFGAVIDCDEAGAAVYRATSSCHVAVSFLPNRRFLYSSFVLQNHVSGQGKARMHDIVDLWKSVRISE